MWVLYLDHAGHYSQNPKFCPTIMKSFSPKVSKVQYDSIWGPRGHPLKTQRGVKVRKFLRFVKGQK